MAACYSVRDTRGMEALESRKDKVVRTKYLRSQNLNQYGTFQKLTRTGTGPWEKRKEAGDNCDNSCI